jgi:hypothetical protein
MGLTYQSVTCPGKDTGLSRAVMSITLTHSSQKSSFGTAIPPSVLGINVCFRWELQPVLQLVMIYLTPAVHGAEFLFFPTARAELHAELQSIKSAMSESQDHLLHLLSSGGDPLERSQESISVGNLQTLSRPSVGRNTSRQHWLAVWDPISSSLLDKVPSCAQAPATLSTIGPRHNQLHIQTYNEPRAIGISRVGGPMTEMFYCA